MKFNFFLFLICLLGIFLRLGNISLLKIYPDAYQNLIAVNSLKGNGTVFGTLGSEGSFYPPFVHWSRPGFPLQIFIMDKLFNNPVKSAEFSTLLNGIIAVLLTAILIFSVFKSKRQSLLAAFLVSVSWNHVAWGGFIGTETLGVLVNLLLFYLIIKSIKKPSLLAQIDDLAIGLIASFSVIVRYEYILIFIPLLFYIFFNRVTPLIKVINILSSMVFVLSVFGATVLPLNIVLPALFQLRHSLIYISAVFAFVVILYFLRKMLFRLFRPALRLFIFIFSIYLTLLILFPYINFPLENHFAAVRDFFTLDFIFGICLLTGLLGMLKNNKYSLLVFFATGSSFLLTVFYYQVNPAMQRYWTHLLPFFIIPASFGFMRLVYFMQKPGFNFLKLIIPALFLYQFYLTAFGLRYWKEGEYFRVSYEEKAAKMVSPYIKGDLLIASFPEPYFYFTRTSTHSVADKYPYVFINNIPDDRKITIVHDMGMRDIFPEFSRFLDLHLQNKKQAEFYVGEIYHYGNRSEKENYPLIIYKTTLGDLKNKIQDSYTYLTR